MDDVAGYVIGGAISLVFLYALSPTIIEFYNDADEAITDEPAVSAALLVVLIIFFLSVAWKVYKGAM